MKAIITLTLYLCVMSACGQDVAQTPKLFVSPGVGKITYEEVIEVDGKTADEIFKKTKEWFVEYFRSAEDVVRGEIEPSMIKGTFAASYRGAMNTPQGYTNDIIVRIKDGALKVTIDNFEGITGAIALERTALKKDGTMRQGTIYQNTFHDIATKCHNLCQQIREYILVDVDTEW